MEGVVHEGWLVKSPPEKRILKAKWRQRWFVLRHSGLLPGQFVLEYFTDDTCRKLKGKIDLDQCEQVDAGLTFEGKKTSYQFMFDIRTPKRIYYLVAETEADMNKWVDCICSVCGLKIHIEEGADSSGSLVPVSMISEGLMSSTALLSAVAVDNNYLTQDPAVSGAVAAAVMTASSTTIASNSSTLTKSSSNPYIPISECHTGKPLVNGDVSKGHRNTDMPAESPPPPPPSAVASTTTTTTTTTHSNWSLQDQSFLREFYDIPRPVQPVNGIEIASVSDARFENYNVPLKLAFPDVTQDGSKTLPPRVNWNTHPKETVVPCRAQSLRRDSADKTDALAVYDIVPPLHSSCKKVEAVRKEAQELAAEFERATVTDNKQDSSCSSQKDTVSLFKAPPRPPKPSKLRDTRHDYENFEPVRLASKVDSLAYDIPQPPKEVPAAVLQSHHSTSDAKKENTSDISLSTKVPLASSSEEKRVDDTYDFPKLRSEDNINALVPLSGSGTAQRQRRHAYTNAPPGLFNSKDLIFNYEYRPSLLNDNGYVNMGPDAAAAAPPNEPPSAGVASALGQYANLPPSPSVLSGVQGDTPPAVDRGLKPNRSSGRGSSVNFLTLQPPPLYKTRANKRSFRRPGDRYMVPPTSSSSAATGLNMTPPVPNRFRHQIPGAMDASDLGSSSGSKHISSDEQARHHFAGAHLKKDEIQYLDLDLDSEPSPSPKSPERVSATVYKKVDFVKTEAFNKMRQNVEETYRKSQ